MHRKSCLKKLFSRPPIAPGVSLLFVIASLLSPNQAMSLEPYHASWNNLLKKFSKNGMVRYEDLREQPADFQKAEKNLQRVSFEEYRSWPQNEKMAFWINAYNIGAMKLVLEHYPIERATGLRAWRYPAESIQQIPGVWEREILEIFGRKRSLNHIENEILRKEFDDPRIHFALVCASRGCPPLRREAYTAARLNDQLDDQVRTFLSDKTKFSYGTRNDTIFLSPIFKWFHNDFSKSGGVIVFVKKYAPPEWGSQLSEKTKIKWLGYDWRLNEQNN